ncbi:hypothetical protein ACFVHB_10800 [Kitasatospora sp. NPDC127111]|uniref:hypothetical protein n=1 Tax=Kitasatospora sp. NPDC127111 TaxID=3345363 RepID=UPI00363F8D63
MTSPEEKHTRRPTALEIATQWAELPPEHLRIALEHLESELQREHEHLMARDRHQAELQKAQAEAAAALETTRQVALQEKEPRAHQLYLVGPVAGFVLAAGMLAGSVIVGLDGRQWLAGLLAGPSLIALPVVFVLRRTDPVLARAVRRGAVTPGSAPAPDREPVAS